VQQLVAAAGLTKTSSFSRRPLKVAMAAAAAAAVAAVAPVIGSVSFYSKYFSEWHSLICIYIYIYVNFYY
jgi:hypothetical protein